MTAPVQETQGSRTGSLLKQRKGPLPVWAWLGIGLGLLLVVVWWRRNRSAKTQAETAAGAPTPTDSGLTNVGQTPIFILPQGTGPSGPQTYPHAPPGGGRHHPPGTPPTPPPPTQTTQPETAVINPGDNLYDWAYGVHPLGTYGDSLNWLRGLNGGPGGLDQLAGTNWRAKPGTTTKDPIATKKATVRIV